MSSRNSGSVRSVAIKPSTRSTRSISVTPVLKLWRHGGRRERGQHSNTVTWDKGDAWDAWDKIFSNNLICLIVHGALNRATNLLSLTGLAPACEWRVTSGWWLVTCHWPLATFSNQAGEALRPHKEKLSTLLDDCPL